MLFARSTENGRQKTEDRRSARLFWFIPVQMDVKTTVNAKTGVVEKIENPWWSFLAW